LKQEVDGSNAAYLSSSVVDEVACDSTDFESVSLRALFAVYRAFAPGGMAIAPTLVVTRVLGNLQVTKRRKAYVVDDSRDFAGTLAAGIHWTHWRWIDSSAARDRADCVHN
jgi:hypothetical protein